MTWNFRAHLSAAPLKRVSVFGVTGVCGDFRAHLSAAPGQQLRFGLLLPRGIDSENVFGLILRYALDRESGDCSDMYGDRKNTPRRCFQRTAVVDALFLGGRLFQVALLLFDPHLAEPQLLF